MKKILLQLLAVLMILTLVVGCGAKEDTGKAPAEGETPAASAEEGAPEGEEAAPAGDAALTPTERPEDGYVFGFVTQTLNNPYFVNITDAATKTIEGNGDTILVADPQMDAQRQVTMVEDMLAQDIDIMVLCPVDSDAVKPALIACHEKGVPVIVYDNTVNDPEYVVSTIASDNYNAGVVVAKDMMEELPEGSKVGIIHSMSAKPGFERVDGFLDTADGYFEIVATFDGKGETDIAMGIAEDVIQGNPDLAAFYAVTDPSAIGCVQAVAAADKTGEILVYGIDGSPMGKQAIVEGKMTGTGAQSPNNIGRIAVESAYKHLAGEPVEKDIQVETFIINAENVQDYNPDGWQ